MSKCSGKCCADGVWLDPLDAEKILRHADHVRSYMDATQDKDAGNWFGESKPSDPDFPSGWARSTTVVNGGCVFLNSEGRCVLHAASNEATGDLKPFYCTAFPVVIDSGVLTIDDPRDPACCTEDPNGSQSIFELCAYELIRVLSESGMEELKAAAKSAD